MSTPVPAVDDSQLLGYCDLWNGYFIGTSLGSVLMILLIVYLSYRRDQSHTPRVIDWGVPWGIGCFLFQLGLWNLAPPNVFFILFKEGLPAAFAMAERNACLQVQNTPIITTFFVLLGIQIVFLYNSDNGVKAVGDEACNDDDLLVKRSESTSTTGSPSSEDRFKVLLVSAAARGRVLWERARRRAEWKKNNGQGCPYVAHTSCIMFPFPGYHKLAGFVNNNMETLGADPADYTLSFARRVTRENVYKMPYESNTFDKVVMSPYFRNGPPIGSFTTSETSKAHRMALLMREVLRVLKPGGKITWTDMCGTVLPGYCDIRDALGEANVQLDFPEGRKLYITPFTSYPVGRAIGVKPLDWVASPRSPTSAKSPKNLQEATVVENEQTLIGITDDDDFDDGKEKLSDTTVMAVMMPIQASLFLGLCFLAAAVFAPLSVPKLVPVGERIGNWFPNLATSYPMMAYMEREYIINTSHFTSLGKVALHMLKTTPLALLATIFFTALFSLPKLGFQVALAETALNDFTRALIGYLVSVLLGFGMYKLTGWRNRNAMLKSKGLDAKYAKYL